MFNPTGSGCSYSECPDMTLESNLKSTEIARWLRISLWLPSPFGVEPLRVLALRVQTPRASPAQACPGLGAWRQLQPAGHNTCMGLVTLLSVDTSGVCAPLWLPTDFFTNGLPIPFPSLKARLPLRAPCPPSPFPFLLLRKKSSVPPPYLALTPPPPTHLGLHQRL